jgi:hypothetical protein
VRDKLKLLVELGYIERRRHSTYVAIEAFQKMPKERAKKFRKIIERAYEDMLPALARRVRQAA